MKKLSLELICYMNTITEIDYYRKQDVSGMFVVDAYNVVFIIYIDKYRFLGVYSLFTQLITIYLKEKTRYKKTAVQYSKAIPHYSCIRTGLLGIFAHFISFITFLLNAVGMTGTRVILYRLVTRKSSVLWEQYPVEEIKT